MQKDNHSQTNKSWYKELVDNPEAKCFVHKDIKDFFKKMDNLKSIELDPKDDFFGLPNIKDFSNE
jgi:hypothetical protein